MNFKNILDCKSKEELAAKEAKLATLEAVSAKNEFNEKYENE